MTRERSQTLPTDAAVEGAIEQLRALSTVDTERKQNEVFRICRQLIRDKKRALSVLVRHFQTPTEPEDFHSFLGDLIASLREPSAASTFETTLRSAKESERLQARSAYYLGLTGSPSVVSVLPPIIADRSKPVAVRADAIAGVAAFYADAVFDAKDHPEVLSALNTAMLDDHPVLRARATRTLGHLRTSQALGSLKAALGDPDRDVCRQAILAVAEGGAETGKETGSSLLMLYQKRTDDYNRGPLIKAFGKLKMREAVPDLTTCLTSEYHPYYAALAADALAQIGERGDAIAGALRVAFGKASADAAARGAITNAHKALTGNPL